MKALGRHILAEFYECDKNSLNNAQHIEMAMKRAAIECGATIVSSTFQTFNPHGVSGVVVIAESHLAIHTWPEYGYAAVDVFTCGETVDPAIANQALSESLQA
ncbi:adenosylmethionine decarboxylase, partial [Candidatus Saccharibacteria bacterium]|nr:adenosylmethionine decarboxylase [Candidatus Saccharibacteria bacterium]NIW79409.1 adenosylmethionine decarboxylase [Calditrichia bacterium]